MWSKYFPDAVTCKKCTFYCIMHLMRDGESLELRPGYQHHIRQARRKLAVNISNYAKYKLTQKFLCSPRQ